MTRRPRPSELERRLDDLEDADGDGGQSGVGSITLRHHAVDDDGEDADLVRTTRVWKDAAGWHSETEHANTRRSEEDADHV